MKRCGELAWDCWWTSEIHACGWPHEEYTSSAKAQQDRRPSGLLVKNMASSVCAEKYWNC